MTKVYIEWIDAYETYGWRTKKEAIKETSRKMLCKSTGWLISANKKRVIITSTCNPASVMSCLHIPVGCIKKMKVVK